MIRWQRKALLKYQDYPLAGSGLLVLQKQKRKIAKVTGIPTTKSGRRNKIGKIFGIK